MKVIKVGAVWCNTCNVMRPRWEKIEKDHSWLKTEYFDFDEDFEAVKKYHLGDEIIPAFIFLSDNDSVLEMVHGEISEKDLLTLIYTYKDQ